MKRTVKKLIPLLTTAVLLTACSGHSAETTAAESSTVSGETTAGAQAEAKNVKETLHIAMAQQPPSLDCHKNSTSSTLDIGRGTLFEQLVTLNANCEPVPELCEKYELSDDNKTLTFYLRKDVKFHDGSTMTADDVVASMNRWLDAFSTARAAVGDGVYFEKVDDSTVKISSDVSLLLFPSVVAGATQPAVITTAAACQNEDSNGYMTEYIGTGPYKFDEWQQDQYIKLERFDDYIPYGTEGAADDGWNAYKTAPTKYLEYDFVTESTTMEAGLETGQYDFLYGVPGDDIERLENTDGIETVSTQAGLLGLVFNKKEGIGTDVNFRQAVNAAMDSDSILTAKFGANGYTLDPGYMDADEPFWQTDAGSDNYNQNDPEKAKEYLEKSEYNGEKIRILCSTKNHWDYVAVAMQDCLKQIGVESDIIAMDWPTYVDYRKDSTMYDIYITGFTPVPLPTLKLFFGETYPGWMTDETLGGYLNEIRDASDMDSAKAVWEKAQAYCWDEYLPLINVGHYLNFYAYSDSMEGINTYNGIHFWNAYAAE